MNTVIDCLHLGTEKSGRWLHFGTRYTREVRRAEISHVYPGRKGVLRIAECGGEMTKCCEKGLMIVSCLFGYLARVTVTRRGDWEMGVA